MQNSQHVCDHAVLLPVDQLSSVARSVGYKPLTVQQRFTAATGSRQRVTPEYETFANLFPLPLVLPGDELAHDPKYPPQSFSSWLNEGARNQVTLNRQAIYVANYLSVGSDAPKDHHRRTTPRDWTNPKQSIKPKSRLIERPAIEDVMAYLGVFFHGLPVKSLPGDLEIGSWIGRRHQCMPTRKKDSSVCVCELPEYVEVRSKQRDLATRVKVRHLHDDEQCSAYQTQLNLNDLLDHAIAILPEDAYCLLMLVDFDLYEDDEDDFCCGRAYGGSRIAVVSSAQYQPALDEWHSVELSVGHNWPGSHCSEFIRGICSDKSRHPSPAVGRLSKHAEAIQQPEPLESQGTSTEDAIMIGDTIVLDGSFLSDPKTPLEAAVSTHYALRPSPTPNVSSQVSSYLRRVALTASHELLHCFGLDHCVYYACAMQGTSSLIEDSRQPPYLCPVCENKLAKAIVSKVSSRKVLPKTMPHRDWWKTSEIGDWKRDRNEAMLTFCRTRGDGDLAFAPLAAWLEAQMQREVVHR